VVEGYGVGNEYYVLLLLVLLPERDEADVQWRHSETSGLILWQFEIQNSIVLVALCWFYLRLGKF